MSIVGNIPLRDLDANPFRRADVYPYVETKIATLMRSIADVGLWEGIIGREVDNRVQIAFGHHRVEAARRSDLHTIPIILRDLTDEQMLKFMGRENGEDYNADFLCMLETWEAAKAFLKTHLNEKKPKAIDIAKLLGWVRPHPKTGIANVTPTAEACSAASRLIEDGSFERPDFEGLNVTAAGEIAGKVVSRKKTIDKAVTGGGADKRKATDMKKAAERGGKEALQKVRSGAETTAAAKTLVDQRVHETQAFKKTPKLVEDALYGMQKGISKMLREDATAEKLAEIKAALKIPGVVIEAGSVLEHELTQTANSLDVLSVVAENHAKDIKPTKKESKEVGNVVPLIGADNG